MAHVLTQSAAGSAANTLAKRKSNRFAWFRRLSSNRLVMFWLIVLVTLILAAIFAPAVAPYDPLSTSADILVAPSGDHLFGTDDLGRDIFSRVIYGARISLPIGLVAVAIAGVAGTFIGLVAGYTGGRTESIIMRCIDVLLAFPGIILAILIMGTLGASLINVMISVGISAIPWYARTVRATTLSVKSFDFVLAARAIGAPPLRIMLRHVLPNVLAPVIVLCTVGVAGAILAISGLSFIGLGARPPSAEWGAMLSQARIYMRQAWWIATFPGIAIMISVLAINVIGDALRESLDPRLHGARKR
jgi:peptide/nickel transport system permease protein